MLTVTISQFSSLPFLQIKIISIVKIIALFFSKQSHHPLLPTPSHLTYNILLYPISLPVLLLVSQYEDILETRKPLSTTLCLVLIKFTYIIYLVLQCYDCITFYHHIKISALLMCTEQLLQWMYTTHPYVIVDGASACWVPRWHSHTQGTCEVSQMCGGTWHGAPTHPMWWMLHHTLCIYEALCLCACWHGSSGMQMFWTHGCKYHIYEVGLQSEISCVWSAGSASGWCSCSRYTSGQRSGWGTFSWV